MNCCVGIGAYRVKIVLCGFAFWLPCGRHARVAETRVAETRVTETMARKSNKV